MQEHILVEETWEAYLKKVLGNTDHKQGSVLAQCWSRGKRGMIGRVSGCITWEDIVYSEKLFALQ